MKLCWLMNVQVSSIKIDPYLNIDVRLALRDGQKKDLTRNRLD